MNSLKKIVVASDSFKGCVSSAQIAGAVAGGVTSVFPSCHVEEIAIGDGGESTAAAIMSACSGRWVDCRVPGPLGAPVDTRYGLLPGAKAVIELASAAGLPLLAQQERNPMLTTTLGVGRMMDLAIASGCREILLCIGGSATNDAAIGLLSALGYRFLDAGNCEVEPCGASLGRIERIDDSCVSEQVRRCRITVACDVSNPMCGERGAAYVFAPQKGADAAMVKELDKGLRHFADVIFRTTGTNVADMPGAGAAGGTGGALAALAGARLKPGIEIVLDSIGFDSKLDGADLVITGEGRIDAQTAMGKAPYGVMQRARRHGVPVVAIGGAVEDTDALIEAGFSAVLPLLPYPASLSEAMDPGFTLANIRRTAAQIARLIGLTARVKHHQQ